MTATLIIADDAGNAIRTARVPLEQLVELAEEVSYSPTILPSYDEELMFEDVARSNNKLWGESK